MKKNYLVLLIVFMAIQFNVFAERINIPGLKIPGLIISEVRPDAEASCYVELTNVGDTAIDLSSFVLFSVFYNSRINQYSDSILNLRMSNAATGNATGQVPLKGVLQPGESFVVASVWDHNDARGSGIPVHNTAIAQTGNQFVHKSEIWNVNGWINKPEWQCFGKDSVSSLVWYGNDQRLYAQSSAGYLLKWYFKTDNATVDSTFIDNFNFFFDPTDNPSGLKGYEIFPIAGVVDAMTTSVMVRKANVIKGNMDWHQSRGVDPTTSEWLVIPKNTSTDMAFNTVGIHGLYDLSFSAKDPSKIVIDDNSMSIPWEMVRGDSLARYFNLGEGMSWAYEMAGSFEDSSSYIARTGDKFTLYAVGNSVKKWGFTLDVRQPKSDVALVFPKRRLIVGEEVVLDPESGAPIDTIITRNWSTGFVYALSKGTEIDSIINVPFATRTDSLFKYLDKPEKANWEFVFVDGKQRVDLQFGDKLKVTSEDGSNIKEYFVAVSDYVPSNNALLGTVTWPDIDKNLYPRWNMGDTLPEFTPLKTEYTIELRFDAMQFPAFQFIPQDIRSRIEVKNAVDLDGTPEQRTTSVTVYAESDTTWITYNFHFVKQGVPVQPNSAEPFFSQFIKQVTTQGWAIEIYNPGTEDLDLSKYCVVRGSAGQTWQEAVATLYNATTQGQWAYSDGSIRIYQTHYFPSKRWVADASIEAWNTVPDADNPYVGKGFLRDDNQTDPWVKGGDVWVMSVGMSTNAQQTKIRQESDFIFRGNAVDNTMYAWDSTFLYQQANPVWTRNYQYLLKCHNDSVLNGTKMVTDPNDYELIDRFEAKGDSLAGSRIGGSVPLTMIRKPYVNKGQLDRIGGGNETAESSEWTVIFSNTIEATNNLGIHVMDPITNYLSTVTSIVLKVTLGFTGSNLSITGNISDYTTSTLATVVDKADSSQTWVFMRGATELEADAALAEDDVLMVTSGDGKNTTSYKLINSPLDDDTSLIANEGSGLIISGDKISGVTSGMSLKDVLANLQAGDKAIINVLDANGALQPFKMYNIDSLVNDVMVSDQLTIQVIAENNDMATYRFDFGLASNEAILLSNILQIDQDKKFIMEFPVNITAPSLLSMVFANEGATVAIYDKAGFEREMGFMSIDDRIVVTAADGVTKVTYRFSEDISVSAGKIAETPFDVVIFPNPVTNVLNIKGFELASVQVYSISGTMMISETASYSNRVDVSRLPHGIYVIKMMDVNGRVAIDKFLKK